MPRDFDSNEELELSDISESDIEENDFEKYLEKIEEEDPFEHLSLHRRHLKGKGLSKNPQIGEASLIQDLVKLADRLDNKKLYKEADLIDSLIQKLSK